MKKTAVFLGMLVAASAFADSGLVGADIGKTIELNGMIQQAFYEQPQAYIILKTSDQIWKVVLAPPARLQERDLSRATMAPGMRVSVEGVRDTRSPQVLQASRITVHDGPTGLLEDKAPLESNKPLEADRLDSAGDSSGVVMPSRESRAATPAVPQR